MSSWFRKRQRNLRSTVSAPIGIMALVSVTILILAACAAGDQGAQGAKGPQGEVGAAGPQGGPGTQGPAGVSGSNGPNGKAGAKGPQGDPGSKATSSAPSVRLSPSPILAGGDYTLHGSGFTPGSSLTVTILENGKESSPPRISSPTSLTVNSNGAFTNVWSANPSSKPGYYTIFVSDASGKKASAPLGIVLTK